MNLVKTNILALALVGVVVASPAAATIYVVNPAYDGNPSTAYTGISGGSGTYGVQLRGGNGRTNGDWEVGVGRRTSDPAAGGFNQGQLSWGCVATPGNPQTGCGTTFNYQLDWSQAGLTFQLLNGNDLVRTVSSPSGANLASLGGNALRIYLQGDSAFTVSSINGQAFDLDFAGTPNRVINAATDRYFASRPSFIDSGVVMLGTVRVAGGRGGTNQVVIGQGNYIGAIPEPASWAMLIAGFGLVGAAVRRRRASLAGMPVTS